MAISPYTALINKLITSQTPIDDSVKQQLYALAEQSGLGPEQVLQDLSLLPGGSGSLGTHEAMANLANSAKPVPTTAEKPSLDEIATAMGLSKPDTTASTPTPKNLGVLGKLTGGKKFNDIFGEGKTLGKDLNLPNLGQAAKDIRQTNLFGMGKIGNLATAGMGLYQGGKALGTGTEIGNNLTDLSNLASQIKASAYSNPLYSSYLNADEKKTLRQLQSGNRGVNGAGAAVQGAMQQLPKALGATLIGGLTGGAGGAIVNGLGSLANGALSGYNNALNERASKLQGLYDTLSSAENDYNSMRRPRNLRTAGLQSAAYRNYY